MYKWGFLFSQPNLGHSLNLVNTPEQKVKDCVCSVKNQDMCNK